VNGVHIEILIEDLSGRTSLEILLPKILRGRPHTYKIHAYKGIGRIPKGMKNPTDASKRILLDNLPKLLQGYGRTFRGYPKEYRAAVVLVCDLDRRSLTVFLGEFEAVLSKCSSRPDTRFCIAIEEGEAWFLGDLRAVRSAYPNRRDDVLKAYVNDSICGTWETLADAIYSGGSKALVAKGWQAVGAEKSRWAESISPKMDVDQNASPSFCRFRDEIRSF
jgi:hypothetical protein